jgi:hypothetical protein
MRYGLSLLVCFAFALCANAADCANGQCRVANGSVATTARVVTQRVVSTACCGQQTTQVTRTRTRTRRCCR